MSFITKQTDFGDINHIWDKIYCQKLTDGVIEISLSDLIKSHIYNWEQNTDYIINDVVLYNQNIYRCIENNNSGTTFIKSNWTKVDSGGIDIWQSSTQYLVNDFVENNNNIYKCLIQHTSGQDFLADILADKWVLIGGGSGGGSLNYSQVTKLGVETPTNVLIGIDKTTNFCLPPIEVLKFVQGTQDVIKVINDFLADESATFVDNDFVEFNGSLKLKTNYNIPMLDGVALIDEEQTAGYTFTSEEEIDVSNYNDILGISVT